MPRIFLTLQYLGTRYAGWQTQANATAVQPIVEAALSRLFGSPIRIEGAGRTDAGVHAMAQRAHADVPFRIEPRGLVLGANNLLPTDVRVTQSEEVADTFHARFDARGKVYRYSIWNAEVADVFSAPTHAHVGTPLDERRMDEAVRRLVGCHDFRPFTVASPEVSGTTRTILEADVERRREAVHLTIAGDGFLRYMVRRIAGSLIEIGRGRLAPEDVFLDPRWTAPAKGLTLERVWY